MTNDQPIRFRTFADEDDAAWKGRDEQRGARILGDGASDPDEPYLGVTLPPSERRPARGGALLAWGTGLALIAGVAIAVTLLPRPGAIVTDGHAPDLTLHVHRYVAAEPGRLASSAMLPCYVNGASVGSLTVTECGQRNGVASGSLDVGLSSAPVAAPPAPTAATLSPAPSPEPTDDAGTTFVRPQPAPSLRAVQPAPATADVFTDFQPARSAPPRYANANLPHRSFDVPSYVPRSHLGQSYTTRSDADDDEVRPDDRAINREDSVRAAQTFYEGLADGDGARAASVVVPEKRRQGPLSAAAISRFYSSLQAPLRLTRLYPVDDHTIVARYAFVDRDGGICQGTARVTTTERDGEVYVQAVKALNGC